MVYTPKPKAYRRTFKKTSYPYATRYRQSKGTYFGKPRSTTMSRARPTQFPPHLHKIESQKRYDWQWTDGYISCEIDIPSGKSFLSGVHAEFSFDNPTKSDWKYTVDVVETKEASFGSYIGSQGCFSPLYKSEMGCSMPGLHTGHVLLSRKVVKVPGVQGASEGDQKDFSAIRNAGFKWYTKIGRMTGGKGSARQAKTTPSRYLLVVHGHGAGTKFPTVEHHTVLFFRTHSEDEAVVLQKVSTDTG